MTGTWLKADWPAPDRIVAGTTLRSGGVSEGPYHSLNLGARVADREEAVAENRRRFLEHCGLPSEPVWLRQVHGTHVVVEPPPAASPEADGVVARQPGTVCAILTADCLPVLFTAADGSEVAAAHAGWRGLVQGVLEATVARMRSAPGRILAWLGPAISQPAFEVGSEVRRAFLERDASAQAHFVRNSRGRWQADLYGLARRRLSAVGVVAVYGGGHCTYADGTRFFSYRRDGECGRMCTFVFRRPA